MWSAGPITFVTVGFSGLVIFAVHYYYRSIPVLHQYALQEVQPPEVPGIFGWLVLPAIEGFFLPTLLIIVVTLILDKYMNRNR